MDKVDRRNNTFAIDKIYTSKNELLFYLHLLGKGLSNGLKINQNHKRYYRLSPFLI